MSTPSAERDRRLERGKAGHGEQNKGGRGVSRTVLSVLRHVEHLGEVTCLSVCRVPLLASRPMRTGAETYLVVGYSSGTVSVYSCSTFRVVWSARLHDLESSIIELHVINDVLLTQSRAGEVVRWQIDWAGRLFRDGRRLDQNPGSSGADADHRINDTNGASGTNIVDDTFDRVYSFSRMCCIPSCRCVAYPSAGGRVTVQNYETDERVQLETTSNGLVTSLAGVHVEMATKGRQDDLHGNQDTPKDVLVCVGYESGRVEVYDVRFHDARGHLVCEIESPGTDPCVALACWAAPDDTAICMARGYAGDGISTECNDQTVRMMHIGIVRLEQNKGTLQYLYKHTAGVMEPPQGLTATLRGMDQVVFRDDGKYVAAACWDGKVRIYRASTGKLVDVILPTQAKCGSSCFAFEDKLLVVGSRDGTVTIWRM